MFRAQARRPPRLAAAGVTLGSRTPAEHARAAGKAQRVRTPRSSLARVAGLADRDPVEIVLASDEGRVPDLIPVRHSRMLESPFAFFRGTADLQAHDLAASASSEIQVQCCGDAHLANFGGFATPERRLIFDINDFDETCPAPFEWDLKRLAASCVLAARWRNLSDARALEIAVGATAAYRDHVTAAASMHTLDAWYASVSWVGVLEEVKEGGKPSKPGRVDVVEVEDRTNERLFHKMTYSDGGEPRLRDQRPLLFHPPEADVRDIAGPFLTAYAATLRPDLRALVSRLRFVDAALKVVGVGSVGTRCFVALMFGEHNEPLFLQIKEARSSVLAGPAGPAGAAAFASNGGRVVDGQRLMQSTSDIFLGWAEGPEGRDYYVRQLRDMKADIDLQSMNVHGLAAYARICGRNPGASSRQGRRRRAHSRLRRKFACHRQRAGQIRHRLREPGREGLRVLPPRRPIRPGADR